MKNIRNYKSFLWFWKLSVSLCRNTISLAFRFVSYLKGLYQLQDINIELF